MIWVRKYSKNALKYKYKVQSIHQIMYFKYKYKYFVKKYLSTYKY